MTTVTTPYRWRWAALAVVLAAEAMNVLDSTIVTVAAPVIHRELAGSASDIQWFSAAYTLPFAVLLINGGRLGDRFGRKRMFRIGVAVFALASLCCALAGSAGMLIAARAVQGAAAAIVIPQTIGLIRATFDGPELAKALGWNGPVVGLAAVCGPLLGGVLTHVDLLGLTWRTVFMVNIPLGVAVLAATGLLREDRAQRRPRVDLIGTALVVLGTGLVVYPMIQHGSPLLIVIGLGVLVLFGYQQRRAKRGGLLELSLFRDRGFPAALASSVLFFAVLNGVLLVVVLQAQLVGHADVIAAGLILLPWSGGMGLASWFGGTFLVRRFGDRLMFAGLAVLLCGLLGVMFLPGSLLLLALGIGGVGVGLFTVPFFTSALHRVRQAETGSAAGLLNSVQQLGGTFGVAVLGSVFLSAGLRAALWLALGLVLLTVLTGVLMSATGEPARKTGIAV